MGSQTGTIAATSEKGKSISLIITLPSNLHNYSHMRGEDENNVPTHVYEQPMEVLVQIAQKDNVIIQDMIDKGLEPKIVLMREPINKTGQTMAADNYKKWTHLTHQNQIITGRKVSSGQQSTANGGVMNPIDTEWNITTTGLQHTSISINPLDWYRRSGNLFGTSVMPIEEQIWNDKNAVRIRGTKTGRYNHVKKALRFKLAVEWTDEEDNTIRLRSVLSDETITIVPCKGLFGIGGQYPLTTSEYNNWFYAFKLDLK